MLNPLFRPTPIPPGPVAPPRVWKMLGVVADDGDHRAAVAWYGMANYRSDLPDFEEQDLLGVAIKIFPWVASQDGWQGRDISTVRPDKIVVLRFTETDPSIVDIVTIN